MMEKGRRKALKMIASTGALGVSVIGSNIQGAQAVTTSANHDFIQMNRCSLSLQDEHRMNESWPMVRFDAASTGYVPHAQGPTTTPSEKWRVNTGEGKISTPIIENGTVYGVKSYPNSDIVAVNQKTGSRNWITRQSEHSYSAPVVMDGNVFQGYQNSKIVKNSGDSGHVKWENSSLRGRITATTILGSTLLVGTGAGIPSISALKTQTGKLCWETKIAKPVMEISGIAVRDGVVYCSAWGRETDYPDFGSLLAINPAAGKVLWEVITTDPARGVSVSEEKAFVRTDSCIHAIETAGGEVAWTVQTRGGSNATPTIADGTVFTGGLFEVVALDAKTGTQKWSHDIRTKNAKPVVANDTVYFTADAIGEQEAIVAALDRWTGDEQWAVDLGQRKLSSPVISNGTVMLSSETVHRGIERPEDRTMKTSEIIALE